MKLPLFNIKCYTVEQEILATEKFSRFSTTGNLCAGNFREFLYCCIYVGNIREQKIFAKFAEISCTQKFAVLQ